MKKSTLRSACLALVLLVPALAAPAVAAESTVEDASPPDARIDRWHDWLYVKVQGWAQGLDHRFIREGEVAEVTPPSAFRISSDAEFVQHSDTGTKFGGKLDVDLLLQLPNLEKRLKIFVTSDDVQESPRLSSNNEDRRLRAGARLALRDSLNFDVGLRVDVPPVAFTAVRWQRQMELGGWDVEPFAKVYLETKNGFGAATGVTFDHWSNRWLVRSSTYGNWRKDDAATAWTQTLLVAHAREILRFGRYGSIVRGSDLVRAYGIQALVSGEKTSSADTYELSVFAKRPTGRNWLYWHVTPLLRWEKEHGWHPDPGIRAGIDILFWDLSDR